MIKSISIKNYLLIDNLELSFNKGLTVITGETGAGKSILLGALSLLLGKRADSELIQNKELKCVIEAEFDLNTESLKTVFRDNDLDFDRQTFIRREILPEGKSRAFINDTPVNLSILKQVGEKLIDLHSQHENLELSIGEYRIAIVDTIAKTENLVKTYQEKFNNYISLKKDLEKSQSELEKIHKDMDYYRFQVSQLVEANLGQEDELEHLEEQSLLLENATEIKESLINASTILSNNEINAEGLVFEAKACLSKIANKYKPADDLSQRLNSILIELRDIVSQINDDSEKAETNPQLCEKINLRIDLLNKLLIKHSAATIRELKQKQNEYQTNVQNTEDLELKILELSQKLEKEHSNVEKAAKDLSLKRADSFEKINTVITKTLKELGIEHAEFKIENQILPHVSQNGIDNIRFLFSANKSVSPQLLEKVASGGEFSRLMLTLKSYVAQAANVPTIIFDEIDTGVSGEIASKMGRIMHNLSKDFQVISITHLPQVASIGDNHYKVYKTSDDTRSYTQIKALDQSARINEIASMISGEKLTPQALENAKILLNM